jgi:hypothetical protein
VSIGLDFKFFKLDDNNFDIRSYEIQHSFKLFYIQDISSQIMLYVQGEPKGSERLCEAV